MVNGRDIGVLDGPDTVLHDADDVLILTPLAGG
jgi:molybdopterin converting factor small subunit